MKKCTKCGIEKDLSEFSRRNDRPCGRLATCKECSNKRNKEWRDTNPQKIREKNKRWNKANPDKVRLYARKTRAKNPEKVRARARKWELANADKEKQRKKKWQKENPLKAKESIRKWMMKRPDYVKVYRAANPEKVKAMHQLRRFQGGHITGATVKIIYDENIGRCGVLTCYLCNKPILDREDNLEHKTPLSRGGTNDRHNLDVSCKKCNNKKHNKTLEEYLQWRHSNLGEIQEGLILASHISVPCAA